MRHILRGLQALLPTAATADGIALLRFLINRYEASVCHLDLIDAMNRIRDSQEPAFVRDALAGAAVHERRYLEKMCENMPDRGCQGQLVSYACSMSGYLQHLRKCYLGEGEKEAKTDTEPLPGESAVTPPPAPV